MAKQIILYHGTDLKSSKNILDKGFDSHTWFATNSRRAKLFGSLKSDTPVLVKVEIDLNELQKRALVKVPTTSKKKPFRIIGYEYLLHSYRLPKLKGEILV